MDHWTQWHPLFQGREGDVWVRPVLGGTPRRIAEDAYYPAWAPDGKKLAYVAWRQKQWGLFIQEVDGASETQKLSLSELPGSAWAFAHLSWSPDGKWIAFTGAADDLPRAYIARSEGGQVRAITDADTRGMMPNWSPDGKWLYFSSDRGGSVNLWKAQFDNGHVGPPQQLTVGSGADLYGRPDPHGERIAYSIGRIESDIWESNLESGRTVRVTSETTVEDVPRPSPDGTLLAFASNRLGGNHLWTWDRRTGELTRVTSTSQPGLPIYSFWSHDGRYLFYWMDTLWQYEVATGSSRKLFPSSGSTSCLSADGKYLVRTTPKMIVRTELASGNTDGLPVALNAHHPACSPDGQWIAASAETDNDRDIWLIPFAGGAPRQLTSDPRKTRTPSGRTIAGQFTSRGITTRFMWSR